MTRMPKTTFDRASLSTAGKLYEEAKERRVAADEEEWNNTTPETSRIAAFWARQEAHYAGMESATVIPLF